MEASARLGPVVSRLTKSPPAIVLCAALCQCAGGPQLERKLAIGADEKAVVAYQNTKGDSLSLVNRSSVTAAEANAIRRQDPGLKVIPDEEVQILLDVFGAHRFFELAADDRDPRAPGWLLLNYKGRTYVMSSSQANKEDLVHFSTCFQAFIEMYNANLNLSGSKLSAADLEKASDELKKSSAAILDKHKKGKTRNQ